MSTKQFLVMIKEKDIEKMSVPERLKAIELLWESISEKSKTIESPNWHKEILEERQKKPIPEKVNIYAFTG